MATYDFETITADEALHIQTGDYLMFAGGSASQARVTFSPLELPTPAHIQVTFGGRTVLFGPELSDLTLRGALEFEDRSRLLIGADGHNFLRGLEGDDALYGGGGEDTLVGGGGDDLLQGNSGNDILHGGGGRDTLLGGQGDDILMISFGQAGEGSWANGNKGDDEISGGIGEDTLLGGQGADTLMGSDGDDWLTGDLGDDELRGAEGDDILMGGDGDDRLEGGFGRDVLYGGAGNDRLTSQGPEGSALLGEDGDDTLTAAGAGADTLRGGAGRDLFEIVTTTAPADGVDAKLFDFESHDQLHFPQASIFGASMLPTSYSEFVASDYAQALAIANEHISAAGATYVAAQVGADVYVFADTGDPQDGADVAILLVGRTLTDISLQNFV